MKRSVFLFGRKLLFGRGEKFFSREKSFSPLPNPLPFREKRDISEETLPLKTLLPFRPSPSRFARRPFLSKTSVFDTERRIPSQNTPLFLKRMGGPGGREFTGADVSAFSREKKFFPSPRSHRFLSKTACFAAAAVLLGGCTLFDPLPPGPPPEGPIVKNAPKRIFDAATAVNYMTTSLSIYLLTEPLEKNVVCLDADEETRPYAGMVLEELSRITGTREVPPPCPYTLKTRAAADAWTFQLLSSSKTLWSCFLSFREKEKPAANEVRQK